MKAPLIIKAGGSLITNKESQIPVADEKSIETLAQKCSCLWREKIPFILIHGAGSFGHPMVIKFGLKDGLLQDFGEIKKEEKKENLSLLQLQLYDLTGLVCKALHRHKVPSFPIQASACAILKKKEILSLDVKILSSFLEEGIVPVLNGVPAYDTEQKIAILSGDLIASYLAEKFHSPLLLHLTKTGGVLEDPKVSTSKIIPEITREILGTLKLEEAPSNPPSSTDKTTGSPNTENSSPDATGKMKKKVYESWKIAEKKIPVIITSLECMEKAIYKGEGGTQIYDSKEKFKGIGQHDGTSHSN